MGRIPSKKSKTGQEVIERMLTKGRIRDSGNNMKFKNSTNNQWYYVQNADMAHLKDAVKYWNQKGKCHRSKSKKVRSFMRDLDNYKLEYFGHNPSQGAFLTSKVIKMKTLSDNKLEKEIIAIVEIGNQYHDKKDFTNALNKYNDAWQLLPEPKLDWEIASWISKCIYSAYFDLSDFITAKKWGVISLQTRGSNINTGPLINLGMVCYELDQLEEAYKYFDEAYKYGKARAFQERQKNI
jgi:tetratricopeptide (TPR) repeat protein